MAKLAELVDHVIGVDPDRDRITAAIVCATTQGELSIAALSPAEPTWPIDPSMRWRASTC
jgi:hypothetical protein